MTPGADVAAHGIALPAGRPAADADGNTVCGLGKRTLFRHVRSGSWPFRAAGGG